MNDELEAEVGGAIWQEDDRDFMVEDILGSEEYSSPPNFMLDIKEHNQGASKETHYACTTYSAYHAGEALFEFIKQLNQRSNPKAGFRKQKEFGTFVEGVGDYVHTSLKSIKEHGLILEDGSKLEIGGFAMVARGFDADHEKIKHFISRGYALVTSFKTRKTDNYKTTGYLSPSKEKVNGGHATAVVGYVTLPNGKVEYIISNSYGEKWGKFGNGTFRIEAEHIFMLGGMYMIYPKQQINMIFKDYSDQAPFAEEVKLMKELGVVKGTEEGNLEPHRPLTRLESIVMMSRLYKKLKG